MSLLNQVQDDVKTAMKAGERERVGALRLVLVRSPPEGGEGRRRATSRRCFAASASAASRPPRPSARRPRRSRRPEEPEAELIEPYLPEQLSDEELRAIVGDAVAERAHRDRRRWAR